MKRMLVTTQQFLRGGLETHIASKVNFLAREGIESFLACGKLAPGPPVPFPTERISSGLAFGADDTGAEVLASVERLMELIETQSIDIVDGHPFCSSLPSWLAATLTGRPFVYTLHGLNNYDASFAGRSYHRILTDVVLANSALIVCVAEEFRAEMRAFVDTPFLVLHNAVAQPAKQQSARQDRWLVAGRLDGDKAAGIRDFLSKSVEAGIERIDVVGDGESRADLQAFAATQAGLDARFLGWRDDVTALYARYRGVVGMGRIVPEAAIAGAHVVMLGAGETKALLDRDLFRRAAFYNFSGRGFAPVSAAELAAQLAALEGAPERHRLADVAAELCLEQNVWPQFVRAATSLRPASKALAEDILDLMRARQGRGGPPWRDPAFAQTAAQLAAQHVVADKDSGRVETMLRRQAMQISSLSEELTASDELVRERREAQDLTVAFARRDAEAHQLAAVITGKDADLAALKSAFDALRADHERLAQVLAESNGENLRLAKLLAEKGTQADGLAQELAAQARHHEGAARNLSERIAQLDGEVMRLANAAQAATAETDAARAENTRLASEMEQVKAESHRVYVNAERLMEENARLDTGFRGLQQENSQLNRIMDRLNEDARRWRQVEKERDDLAAEVAWVRADHRRMSALSNASASALAAMRAGLRDATQRVGDLAQSRLWRISQAVWAAKAAALSGPLLGRPRALARLVRNVLLRRPLGAFDRLAFAYNVLRQTQERLVQAPDDPAPIASAHSDAVNVSREQASSRRSGAARGERGLVSIVLPVYNHARYLGEAINGAVAQTYPHWELIVVDDGSTDDFASVIARHTHDPRIRVLRQPNQKLPSALNNGFREARGEYLTWTSADNIMLPQQIERLVAALESHSEAGLAYSDYEAIDDCGAPLRDPAFRPQNRDSAGSSIIHLPQQATIANFHESGDNFLGASWVYRADAAAAVGSYDEGTFGGEDYDYWMRLHMVTPFIHVDEVLYRYRVHDDTLNARAVELDLFSNIRRLLEHERERRAMLLAAEEFGQTNSAFWRSADQYRAPMLAREVVAYSSIAGDVVLAGVASDRTRVCVVDVPLRTLDLNRLRGFDIITAADEAIYFWLKRQDLPPACRLLCGEFAPLGPIIDHIVALRAFERRREQSGHRLSSKPPAKPHDAMSPRNVLIVVDLWREGGVEHLVLDLARGLAGHGAEVTIAAAREAVPESLRKAADSRGVKTVSFADDAARFERYLAEHRVDVVNFHHSLFGLAQARERGVRTVYTAHNSYLWFSAERRGLWKEGLQQVDRVIAVSRQVASYLAHNFAVDPGRIVVIPNGIELPPGVASGPDRGAQPDGAFRFINVATFNRVKMQTALLKAFAALAAHRPGATLTLIGVPVDKGFFEEVEALREALNLRERVRVVPGADHAAVLAELARHDCFVLPSVVEGWSIALMEAAALGLPIVATDVGAARDLRQCGAVVRLVPHPAGELDRLDSVDLDRLVQEEHPALIENLAAAMVDVANNGAERKSAAQAAAADFVGACSLDAMIRNYLNIGLAR